MKILLLDNYDSFTYNLFHLVEKVSGQCPDVYKNDAIGLDDIAAYNRIILSPGPGLPSEAGVMPDLIRKFRKTKPILGVCLGFQAIGEMAGARLRNLDTVCHGQATRITVDKDDALFRGCPSAFMVGRYHSWVIDENNLPAGFVVTAHDENGLVMAGRLAGSDVCGIQFHPESILSEHGETMMDAWLRG